MEQVLQCVNLWDLCSQLEPTHVLENSPTASYFLTYGNVPQIQPFVGKHTP